MMFEVSSKFGSAHLTADKAAVSLSVLCVLHCLAVPLLAAMLPSLIATSLEGEAFHLWMVVAVIPISVYALSLGCRRHQNYGVAVVGCAGLFVLCLSLFLGHEGLGETGEKLATVFGAALLAVSHILNFRLCQSRKGCGCAE